MSVVIQYHSMTIHYVGKDGSFGRYTTRINWLDFDRTVRRKLGKCFYFDYF